MILPFPDSMNFVTLSLDGIIKCTNMEGETDYDTPSEGQILNGCAIPAMKDYYVISTQNSETNESGVFIYRRKKMVKHIGPTSDAILDVKVIGDYLYMTNSSSGVDRLNIKEF